MKKLLFLIVAMLSSFASIACPACEKAQPKIFRGITHGTGPDSNWDYLIIAVTVFIVVLTATLSVMRLIQPNENNENHIKNLFLK